MMTVLLSFIFGVPVLQDVSWYDDPEMVTCGYIAHSKDVQDTFVRTTRDHCDLLMQETVDVYWQDSLVALQEKTLDYQLHLSAKKPDIDKGRIVGIYRDTVRQ